MKKSTKALFAVAALAAGSLFADEEYVYGYVWSYDIVGEGAEITAIDSKPDGNLNIPTHLGGKPVVSLGGNALFYACSGLVEVRIPGSVTNIGNATFAFCSNLASVNIPDGVKSIGSRAFYWCDGLSDISLPDGVESFGDRAFFGCAKLADADGFIIVQNILFGYTGNGGYLVIPDGVTRIDTLAFDNRRNQLTGAQIPDTVTDIRYNAFYGCSYLKNVKMPKLPVNLAEVFEGCPEDMSITYWDYALTLESSDAEYGTVFGGGTFVPGTEVTITATANDGCAFVGWFTDAACTYPLDPPGYSNDSPTVKISTPAKATTIYAKFKLRTYALTLRSSDAKHGTVSGGGKYVAGKNVTIKAAAKSGCAFGGWFTDKKCTKQLSLRGYDFRSPTVKVSMPANDTTIYAKFVTVAVDKDELKFSSDTKKLENTPAKATAGAAFSLKLGISSASLVTVTAKDLPNGLSIDKKTGEITGTATETGSFTATVTVKDAAGNKISQKVKIKVDAPSWAKGTFYGTAKPGKKASDPAAYLQFTADAAGKVSGKVTYKGKAYSFTSAYKSCTSSKAKFAPKVKIGSSTFSPGTVTVKKASVGGLSLVEASVATDGVFAAQKKSNLVKKGKALAAFVGKKYSFTKKDKNSGLKKSKDKLSVAISDGDAVKVSGTVNGKKLTAISAPLLVSNKETADGLTTYTLYVDIIDAALKYERTLVFAVTADGVGKVKKVTSSFR